MGEGSIQSARVHRLVKAFVDQIKKNVHSPTKSMHVTDISKFN